MKSAEFEKHVEQQLENCRSVLINRARNYASREDRLANFKTAARRLNVQPETAARWYREKHETAMSQALDTIQEEGATEFRLETWQEWITDSMNYLILLGALLKDRYTDDREMAKSK